jgi:TRAP-type C4-dicarboxylate transport system permease small subunit
MVSRQVASAYVPGQTDNSIGAFLIMQAILRKIEKTTDLISGHLQGWLVFLLMVLVLGEVLTRYILQSPLSVADEMGGYLLVSITFLGLGYTWKEEGHVRVELITNILPEKIRRRLRFATLLMATFFCIPMIAGSYSLIQDSLLFEARSGSWMRTPLVYPQALLLVGSLLLLLQLVAEIMKALLAGNCTKAEGRD